MNKDSRIYVAGHRGLVGSAILRSLQANGYNSLIVRTHQELDLTDQAAVGSFFDEECPEYVFIAAAKVGGIHANNAYPAEFIQQNLAIQTNVLHEAWKASVKTLLFLGSSCIYPRDCPQPMKEEYIMTGPLEPTNRAYSMAKIAGLEMCWSYNRQYNTQFRAVMPTNLYGPGDNFHLENSHVIPALIHRFHDAKVKERPRVEVWGTGKPKREFIFVDDLGEACLFVMKLDQDTYERCTSPASSLLNIGIGEDLSIRELANKIQRVVGFEGQLIFDRSRSDGTPVKLLDVSRLSSLGWTAKTQLEAGLGVTYKWFLENQTSFRN